MKAHDFSVNNQFDPNSFKVIKAKELVYLRYSSIDAIFGRDVDLITQLAKQTSNLYVSLPESEFADPASLDRLVELGVKGVSLQLKYVSKKWLTQVGFGNYHTGDRDVVERYLELLRRKPRTLELVAEFELDEDSRLLGPTIATLHYSGCPWVVVNTPETPNQKDVRVMAEMFEYLKIRNIPRLNVYFPFWHETQEEWNIKTQNIFSGLREVHIDLSNKCTHSCVFCGLYAPENLNHIKETNEGKIPKPILDHMSKEINYEKSLEFIETLPWTVRQIQFGGLGDPLMHKNAVDLVRAARERGFYVEMLSNMDYLSDEDIQTLHELGGAQFWDLHFIANVSGGDVETYIATRPKQTAKNFENVKRTLSKLSQLRQQNNNIGVNFTIMCVVNKNNCTSLLNVAKYAHEVGAKNIWLKPMEVHGEYHKRILPEPTQLIAMANSLKTALAFCDNFGIYVFERHFCEQIINQYKELADVK